MNAIWIGVRALHFGAVATMFGGAGFLVALRRRPRGAMAILRAAAGLAAISGAAWFALVFIGLADGVGALVDPSAWSAFAGAPFGTPWLLRLALCAMALVLGLARAPAPFLALGGALVVDQAWLGHTADGPASGLVVYWLHVGAGFAWVGALVMLCVAGFAERAVPADGLALFHRYGIALVATLVLGALAEAAARGVTPVDLATTPYGLIIAGKSLVLVAMLALALRHRLRPAASLRTSLPVEAMLGLGVLVLAAALGITPPG